MNQIFMIFGGAVVFAWFGLNGAGAQMLERPRAGQKIAPQSLAPAQPPLLPLPPGFIAREFSSDEHPKAGAKANTANQASRVNGYRTDEKAKESEQTKVTQVYHGGGYFDAALAEKLKPMLAKALGASKGEQKQLPRTSQPVSGNEDSAENKNQENVRKITQSGGL